MPFLANVSGRRIKATLAPIKSNPTTSSLMALDLILWTAVLSLSDALMNPRVLAFLSAQRRVTMRGRRAAGTRMANIPSIEIGISMRTNAER